MSDPSFALPASKSRLGKLGKRMAAGMETDADQDLYVEVLDVYDRAQQATRALIESYNWDLLGVVEPDVTGRAKTRDTLVQKLQRSPSTQLPYIRDIAGVRVVADMCLLQQNVMARVLKRSFGAEDVPTVDRIREPMHGYRALHVVIRLGDVPVEIQVRTRLQHMWAEMFERVADTCGRQIRYGEPPTSNHEGMDLDHLVDVMRRMSLVNIARHENTVDRLFRLRGPISSNVIGDQFRERLPAPLTEQQATDLRSQTDELDAQLVTQAGELEEILLELGTLLDEEPSQATPDV